MKHNYLAWRYLDPSPTDQKGSEAIVEAIKELGKKHTEQVKAVEEAQKKALEDANKILQDEVSKAKAEAQKTADKLTALEQKLATNGMRGNGSEPRNFQTELEAKLTENKSKLPTAIGQKFAFEMDTKVVGNLSSAGSLTGSYFVQPTVVPGVFVQPYNQTHLRDILPIGNTNSNLIRYVRDNGGQGGPAMTAEGNTKPQMDRALSIQDAPVRKIATNLRVPDEMIEDIPYLATFLSNVGTQEVLAVEDTQILYGDGTGQNLSGLATAGNFTAFAADAGGGAASGVITSPNEYDVLRFADKQMRVLKRTPSVALVSPVDYVKMVSRKDTTNNYILSGGGNGLQPTVNGFPIMQLNQVAAGDFLVLDRNAAQIFFREAITVKFYEQDQDNAIRNMVTIVIEERLALPIYYITGIVKGTFATAITDLTS